MVLRSRCLAVRAESSAHILYNASALERWSVWKSLLRDLRPILKRDTSREKCGMPERLTMHFTNNHVGRSNQLWGILERRRNRIGREQRFSVFCLAEIIRLETRLRWLEPPSEKCTQQNPGRTSEDEQLGHCFKKGATGEMR
jgi:hypothetical protein